MRQCPDVGPFGYLLEMLMEAGPMSKGSALSWDDLRQWSKATCTPVCAWEMRTLKKLSGIFSAALSDYTNVVTPSPIQPKKAPDEIRDGIRNALRAIAPKRRR